MPLFLYRGMMLPLTQSLGTVSFSSVVLNSFIFWDIYSCKWILCIQGFNSYTKFEENRSKMLQIKNGNEVVTDGRTDIQRKFFEQIPRTF